MLKTSKSTPDVPPVSTPEYRALRERDRRRRVRAADLLGSLEAAGGFSAADLYHAAWLFNHGDQPAEARRAHEAAERGHRPARWLAAAAYDRWCMYEGRGRPRAPRAPSPTSSRA
jgi:hypothetical protein